MATGIGLSRPELDQGASLPDIWKDNVENLCKDDSFRPTFPFVGAINDVDCSAVPLHHRKVMISSGTTSMLGRSSRRRT